MNNLIGKRIAERRKFLGITGQQIKDQTGISTGNLSGIEKGNSLPSAAALIGLSKILNCSVDWILKGESLISEKHNEIDPTDDKTELLNNYSKLDSRGKHRIHTVIYEELDRINSQDKEKAKTNVG